MSYEQTEQRGTGRSTVRERTRDGGSRREFLRTLASAGYVGGIAYALGVDDFLAAGDGEVEIATAMVRDDPADPWSLSNRTRAVPADWYESVRKAFELNELLAETQVTGYLGSTVVPGSYSDGTATVSVGVSSEASTLRDLISLVGNGVSVDIDRFEDGVSVDIDRIEDFEEGLDSDNVKPRFVSDLYDGVVPAGVAVRTDTSMATVGPALHHRSGEGPFFTTAEHAFEVAGEPRGEPLLLPTEDGETSLALGRVRYYHPVEDVVAVEPDGGVVPGRVVDQATPVDVNGQYTRWGLADLIARGEDLEKVGAMTGHTIGAIQGIDAITCFTEDFCRRGQIRWGGEMDLIDGDSGSVSYHTDPQDPDGGVLIAGFNNARTWWPGQSYVWGVAAYYLFEQHGYHF